MDVKKYTQATRMPPDLSLHDATLTVETARNMPCLRLPSCALPETSPGERRDAPMSACLSNVNAGPAAFRLRLLKLIY